MGTATTRLGAGELTAFVRAARDVLAAHAEAINRLNVYPVPDGDTGTNMRMTLEAVVAELDGLNTSGDPDLEAVCRAIAHGALMGARGNSGVICSQILRGLVTPIAEAGGADAGVLARALRSASDSAVAAVQRPVEGTILTVCRAAAEAAARADGDLASVVQAARAAAAEALEATPTQLEVLARAGVVDAGGAGLVRILEALEHVVTGRPLPEPPPVEGGPVDVPAAGGVEDGGDLRFEVMFLLEADDGLIDAFREVWAGIGDSIAVVGGDGLWNCHIHTNDIGAAIEAALDVGRPRRIRVTDLAAEVAEERWVREHIGEGEPPETGPPGDVRCAVVAVAAGDGVRRIFRSLRVARVVEGGQTMNPSTAQLLEAVEATGAPEVVVLPNNRNIIPVARQVAEVASRPVRVVPTRSVIEGFTALLAYDPDADADTNAGAMAEMAAEVRCGEVTRAVRDATTGLGPVRAGDWLGLTDGEVAVVAGSASEAAIRLLDRLLDPDGEKVTMIVGADADDGDVAGIRAWLSDHHPDVELEVLDGGQPLYPFLFGVE